MKEYYFANFEVDQRFFRNVPLLILDLGNHDIIIGKTFFASFGINLDVSALRLLWPTILEPNPSYQTFFELDKNEIQQQRLILGSHQNDVDKRDKKMLAEER